MRPKPNVLVTGFSVFPGAPVNPTEGLVARLARHPPAIDGAFRAELLAVEYGSIGARLEAIAAVFPPDIAIHFGLASECTGFRLERTARNEIRAGRPDNAGAQPSDLCISPGGGDCASTLPLDEVATALAAAGLPVTWSDDAGGYLCNYLFYLSASPHFPHLAPDMTGFVHVPPLAEPEHPLPNAMTLDDIERGARIVIATCVAAWRAARANEEARRVAGPS